MPQSYTTLLNDTIADNLQPTLIGTADSVSVRLNNLAEGTYPQIFGLAFGISAITAPLGTFAASLVILRNVIFDPLQNYGNFLSPDIVWKYTLNRDEFFAYKDFKEPLKLNDASDYLLVFTVLIQSDIIPPAPVYGSLTARGNLLPA